jgi:hypothetical protein
MSLIFGEARPLVLWPTMSGGSAIVTATTAFRAANGSVAVPSYSFTNDTDTGLYSSSANVLGVTVGGVAAFLMGRDGSGGYLQNGSGTNNYLGLTDLGAINLNAAGTNQNITLTPSGTGVGSVSGGVNRELFRVTDGTNRLSFHTYTPNSGGGALGYNGTAYVGLNPFFGLVIGRTPVATPSTPPTDGLIVQGNSLFGGLYTNGTGVLQLATATTSAGGITQGDINQYRTSSAFMSFNASSGTQMGLDFYVGGVRKAYFYWAGSDFELSGLSGTTIIKSNNTLALTLDTSQNATFAGFVRPVNLATASAPTYAKGVIYFDTTLNKLRVGGATAFETITSA